MKAVMISILAVLGRPGKLALRYPISHLINFNQFHQMTNFGGTVVDMNFNTDFQQIKLLYHNRLLMLTYQMYISQNTYNDEKENQQQQHQQQHQQQQQHCWLVKNYFCKIMTTATPTTTPLACQIDVLQNIDNNSNITITTTSIVSGHANKESDL